MTCPSASVFVCSEESSAAAQPLDDAKLLQLHMKYKYKYKYKYRSAVQPVDSTLNDSLDLVCRPVEMG